MAARKRAALPGLSIFFQNAAAGAWPRELARRHPLGHRARTSGRRKPPELGFRNIHPRLVDQQTRLGCVERAFVCQNIQIQSVMSRVALEMAEAASPRAVPRGLEITVRYELAILPHRPRSGDTRLVQLARMQVLTTGNLDYAAIPALNIRSKFGSGVAFAERNRNIERLPRARKIPASPNSQRGQRNQDQRQSNSSRRRNSTEHT